MTIERPLRVTVVLPHPAIGGAELWLLSLIDATAGQLELDAIVLADYSPLHQLLVDRGISVRSIPTGTHGRHIALSAARLSAVLRVARPDVLLCNGVKAAAVGVIAGRVTGVRVAWCKHDFVFDGSLGRLLARLSDCVIATSHELLGRVRPLQSQVLPPPLPPEPVDLESSRAFWQRLKLPMEWPVLAMFSRLVDHKAIDIAIRALASPEGRTWRLAIVGPTDLSEPDLPARLRGLAASLGVGDRVHFLGQVPEAGRWLRAMDAVAVLTVNRPTSNYGPEGFGIVVLESLFAGVPVIVTPQIPAALLGRDAVVQVRPESPQDVAAALARVPLLRPMAGLVAERLCKEHPDAVSVAQGLVDCLAVTAGRPGAGSNDGPSISVVTTVLNKVDSTERLMSQLSAELREGDELLVVDAGSIDGTRELLEQFQRHDPRLRILHRAGSSIAEGRNVGAQAARCSVLAFTDAGCDVRVGWLNALRAPFRAGQPPDLVTGVYRADATGAWQRAFAASSFARPGEALHPSQLVRAYGRLFGRVFDPVLCTGRSMAVTRTTWAAVGGFPEHLQTAEDVTFGRTIARAGRRCILSVEAEVVWDQRSTIMDTARMYFEYGRGGGHSGDRLLISRDIARAAAYGLGLWSVNTRSKVPLILAGLGAATYLSLPVERSLVDKSPFATIPLLPLTLAVKDLPKAAGCLVGLAERWLNARDRGTGTHLRLQE